MRAVTQVRRTWLVYYICYHTVYIKLQMSDGGEIRKLNVIVERFFIVVVDRKRFVHQSVDIYRCP